MKRITLTVSFLIYAGFALSQAAPARPRILGIDHFVFYTSDLAGAKKLYEETFGLPAAAPVEDGGLARFVVGAQWIGLSTLADAKTIDHMGHVAFLTDNVSAMREYLSAKGIPAGVVQERADHSRVLAVSDPEGHAIEFVEHAGVPGGAMSSSAISAHLIHAGFLVHSRAAADKFYRDVLGFHLYWNGGMQSNMTEWVSMQAPDGTDWLEYMVSQPEHPTQRLTGVMNHISLGVPDIHKAQETLEQRGWKPSRNEHAQLGRDGKWQLNMYDPDLTRVELMEFRPAAEPCCSAFAGVHPER